MSLNDKFTEQIRLHPREAKSHFEIVDPDVWRVVRKGEADSKEIKRLKLIGPFSFNIDGVSYEAYARRSGCADSQRMFLDDWAGESSSKKEGVISANESLAKPVAGKVASVPVSPDAVKKQTHGSTLPRPPRQTLTSGATVVSPVVEATTVRRAPLHDVSSGTSASSLATMILRSAGIYSDEALEKIASQRAANPGMGLAEAAVKFGGVKELEFLTAIGGVLGLKVVDLEKQNPSPEALQKLPASAVYQFNVLPFQADETSLTVVTPDPFDTKAADGLRLVANCRIRTALAPKELVEKTVKKFYGVGAEAIEKMLEDGRYDVGDEFGAMTKIDVNEMGEEASIVRFVNQIIAEADRQGATDIHIEPQETELRIRYRIDGMLHKVDVPPQLNRLKSAIISRIKVMANLDIAEKRLPMDGRIGIRIQGQDIDIRVSTMPAAYGESISLRLLAKSGSFVKMDDLGFNDRDYAVVNKIIHRPNGIFLVTGPTGSGKSTSLYSFLSEVNKIDVRIMTAEDPIEYHMAGINQVQMQSEIGMTFARALRAFLRQDPDIIMVGEIRDRETAEIAINASLTGHMVFSTLHTNDAAGAFPRLIDMGVEPFLIASAVAGVMGQRLCRRLCPDCRKEVPLDMKYYNLDMPPERDTVFEPFGCDRCSKTGYKGRRALFEVLDVDEDIEGAIVRRENATQIRNLSLSKGMKTLREDGWAKVFRGVTSVKEILRVTEDQ